MGTWDSLYASIYDTIFIEGYIESNNGIMKTSPELAIPTNDYGGTNQVVMRRGLFSFSHYPNNEY